MSRSVHCTGSELNSNVVSIVLRAMCHQPETFSAICRWCRPAWNLVCGQSLTVQAYLLLSDEESHSFKVASQQCAVWKCSTKN